MSIEDLLKTYRPSEQAISVVGQARIVILAGIVAAGKDTLQKRLLREPGYQNIVTHTTRAPRENDGVMEQNGREYHFVTKDKMRQLVEHHEMIEVNKFGENFYGTHVSEFQRAFDEGKIALSNIDINGVASFRAIAPDVIALFIVPPDYETWRQRLESRYESIEAFNQVWKERRSLTITELEHALSVPYYHFIINDELERAVSVIDKIAMRDNTVTHRDDGAKERTQKLLESIKANK